MKKTSFWARKGTLTVLASLISILIGMVAGAVFIVVVGLSDPTLGGKSVTEGIQLVLAGLFNTGRDAAGSLTFGFNPVNIGNMLFRATPLLMTGLSVALGMKAGLFNIGTPGQYLMGTCVSLYIALSLPVQGSELSEYLLAQGQTISFYWNPSIVWLLAFAGGMLAGAVWGAIPGMLKAFLNINEVLACIMTNWIAANLVTWIFDVSTLKNMIQGNKTSYVYMTTYNNVATSKMGLDKVFPGSQVNGGIIVAIIFAVLMFILMSKTTTGYEIKACGANRFASRYAGIQDRNTIILTMALAGALAAAGGCLYYLAGNTEFYWSTYQSLPSEGFNGIPVALLAANNPLGVIFTAMFMSMLKVCGTMLSSWTAFNEYITDVIISVIVYLSAFSLVIRLWLSRRISGREKNKANANSEPAKATGKEAGK